MFDAPPCPADTRSPRTRTRTLTNGIVTATLYAGDTTIGYSKAWRAYARARPQVSPAGVPSTRSRGAPARAAAERRAAERRNARAAHRVPVRGLRRGAADRELDARAVSELPGRHPRLPPVHPLRHEPALRVRRAHRRADRGQERSQRLRLVLAPGHGRARRLARLDAPQRHPPRVRQPVQEVVGRCRHSSSPSSSPWGRRPTP